MNTESTVLTKQFEQMIREGEIMMRGSDPEQRERGRQRLLEVVSRAEGSIYAQEALQILAAAEPRLQESPDPELDELIRLWPSIQGFSDYRLAGFLRRLKSYQGMAVPLRTEVVRELQKWIIDVLRGVSPELSSGKTEALNEFVAAVRGVAAFEEIPGFGQLRDRLFQKRLEDTTGRVYKALADGALDEAQQTIRELTPFPDAFKTSVDRLQAEIDEFDALSRTVDRLLRQTPDQAATNWFEARLQVELQQQLEHCRTNKRVPQDWRQRLDEAVAALTEFVTQFIRGQAQAAVTIPLLRDFWTEFQRLRGDGAEGGTEVSEHLFAAIGDALIAVAQRDVERAADVDQLMIVANRLRADAEGIPPAVASRVSAMADAVNRIGTTWRSMAEGQSFDLLRDGSGLSPLPTALTAEAQRYTTWLGQIETALNSLSRDSLQLKDDYEDRLRLAESVLAEVPHHALALKLQQEATRRVNCYHLDQSLLSWNVESFFKLFNSNGPGEVYSALIAHKDVLIQLRDLTQQPQLTNWRGASDWWARWQAAIKRLPPARPDALTTALDQEAAKRQLEHYTTLELLLQNNLTPREYEDAAASLEDETDSTLRSYRQELLRRAIIGRIEEHISNGRLKEAVRELGKLPPTSTDALRLRTHLEFAQARGRGSAAAAEYLFHEWENVRVYMDQPDQLALETMTAVWKEEQQDAVVKMSRLISRLLREVTESRVTQKLADWQTWLEIEDGLLSTFSSGGVKQLSEYLRNAERGELLDDRLKRILWHWQSEGNTVMLAWAFQAFHRVSTAARQFDEAADDLVRGSDEVARDVDSVLTTSDSLELDDLKPLQISLQQDEERWRLLDDFLSLLPHPVERPQPSESLAKAKQRLNQVFRILTILAHLQDADLRREPARQDYSEAYSRTLRLRDIGSRTYLLEQLERLRPLREDLFFLEQRMRETAERCCSKEALNVLEPSLFDQLAGYVRKAVEIFIQAGARGGAMWLVVSAEYERKIYRDACVLLPVSGSCELDQLVNVLEALHAEESKFTHALSLLEDRDRQPTVAWSGTFDPKPHLDYLALIPREEPRALKIYHRFERARRDTLKIILEAPESRPHLPVWVHNYLDNGVPVCANGQ